MDSVTVPRGFCLTVKFFEALIDSELRGLLGELETSSKIQCSERQRLEASCDNVQRKIKRKRLIFLRRKILTKEIFSKISELSGFENV